MSCNAGLLVTDSLSFSLLENVFLSSLFIFKIFTYFIYLFLVVLGLRCCTQAFSSCGEVRRLLTAVASLVVEHGL